MNWLHYLLEANLYLGAFYLVYYLFLSNQTWYGLNRAYLLISSALAFAIPFFQLGFLKPVESPLQTVTLISPPQISAVNMVRIMPATPQFTWQDGLIYLYLTGVAVLFIVFVVKLYQLFKLTRANDLNTDNDYKLVYVDGSNTAFSFFNFLFIGTNTQKTDTIIKHELVHITQKHSADIIFIELLKIVNWFNPFVYLLQYSLKAIHEYIADEQTSTAENDTIAYSTFLVNNAYGLSGSSITHSFFNYNLLKKRIIMLNQKRSGKLARLRYLLVIPVCLGLLCASTLAFSKSYGLVNIAPAIKADTPKHVHFIAKNDIVNYNNAYTTTKGYDVTEYINNHNGAISKKVTITDKDGSTHTYYAEKISADERKMLQDKYGYTFPSGKLTQVKLLPPPPPPSPGKEDVKILAPAVKRDAIRIAPPTVHTQPTFTKTGYRYEEDGYTINGKTDFRVIIVEKDGSQKEYFKSKASPADLKLLQEKYGYSFPVMEIYTKMPPPPPTPAAPVTPAVDNRPPPPPPAPPATKDAAFLNINNMPANMTLNGITFTSNRPAGYNAVNPLIIVNGTKYYSIGKISDKQFLSYSATDSVITFKDANSAQKKLGSDAKNGAYYLYGDVELAIVARKTSAPKL